MTEISEDTEKSIRLVYTVSELIMHRIELANGTRVFTGDQTLEGFDAVVIEGAEILYNFVADFENQYGGGWTDIGPSRALRLISEGDVSDFNLVSFFESYQTIINKLVLLDSHRAGQASLEEVQQSFANFNSGKKVRAA